jgi:hypothetical protein
MDWITLQSDRTPASTPQPAYLPRLARLNPVPFRKARVLTLKRDPKKLQTFWEKITRQNKGLEQDVLR